MISQLKQFKGDLLIEYTYQLIMFLYYGDCYFSNPNFISLERTNKTVVKRLIGTIETNENKVFSELSFLDRLRYIDEIDSICSNSIKNEIKFNEDDSSKLLADFRKISIPIS